MAKSKQKALSIAPDYADALVIWNWVRRHHGEGHDYDIDDEYRVDSYMEEWFAKTNEYDSETDDADYEEMESEDIAEYEY